MLKFISGADINESEWSDRIWRFRHKHFVEKFGWEALRKLDGLERDEFDREDALHLVLVEENEVVGYSRLLPTTKPHLLSHVYPEITGGNPYPIGPLVYEWTRCVAEQGHLMHGVQASNLLLVGVLEFCLVAGIEALIVETHPKLVNVLVSTGWEVSPLAAPAVHCESLVVPIHAVTTMDALFKQHELYGIDGSLLDLSTRAINPISQQAMVPILETLHFGFERVERYA